MDTGQWPVSSNGECPERDGIGTLDQENAIECRESGQESWLKPTFFLKSKRLRLGSAALFMLE